MAKGWQPDRTGALRYVQFDLSTKGKIAAALLLFLYLLPLWVHPFFPSQDGPSHLYNSVVFTELLWNPKSFFSLFYEINARPYPNWTFTLLASVFHPLLPIGIVEKLIPAVAKEKLATSVDAFCETIAFTPEEVERVFKAAGAHGLRVRLHAEQLSNQSGAALAAI